MARKQWSDLNNAQKAAILDFHHIPHGIKPSATRKKAVRREAPILAAITAMLRLHPMVATVERRQGLKIGCPEEAALTRSFLTIAKFEALLETMPRCEYRDYLASVAAEYKRTHA